MGKLHPRKQHHSQPKSKSYLPPNSTIVLQNPIDQGLSLSPNNDLSNYLPNLQKLDSIRDVKLSNPIIPLQIHSNSFRN